LHTNRFKIATRMHVNVYENNKKKKGVKIGNSGCALISHS